jgi:hypothetical protein
MTLMAIRIKLGDYQRVSDDPLHREYIGYFPRMTQEEAWEAGRGVWKMNRERAARERFALIIGERAVRAVAEITGVTDAGDRVALDGQLLEPGHLICDTYLGAPDPVNNGSQNPIAYCELAEEAQYRLRQCACGCGETGERDFLPGHEIRAIQARIRARFGGSPLRFIQWLDAQVDAEGVRDATAGAARTPAVPAERA